MEEVKGVLITTRAVLLTAYRKKAKTNIMVQQELNVILQQEQFSVRLSDADAERKAVQKC